MFQVYAGRYREILASQGVTLKIVPSQGSLENLKRLSDPEVRGRHRVRPGGTREPRRPERLMSLGSVFYVPVLDLLPGAAADQAASPSWTASGSPSAAKEAVRASSRRRCSRRTGSRRAGDRSCSTWKARPRRMRCSREGRRDLPDGRLGDARHDARAHSHEQRATLRLRPGRRVRAPLPLPDQARAAAGVARPRQEHAGGDADHGGADGRAARAPGPASGALRRADGGRAAKCTGAPRCCRRQASSPRRSSTNTG